jgi:hypothetical protein
MSIVLSAADWAVQEFGTVQLGDKRRSKRAVKVACAMASDPSGSIPQQNKKWKQTKGAYRLFNAAQTTFESMISPHWERTRALAGECSVVLMIQDTTQLDYTSHPGCEGLGRFGGGPRWVGGLGLNLHNVLALEPLENGQARIVGLAWNKLWARTEPVRDKRRNARELREQGCESDRWIQAVDAIGDAPPASRFVHVGDRESDIFELYKSCRQRMGVSFLVRVSQLKRAALPGHVAQSVKADDRPQTNLKQIADALPVLGGRQLWIAPRKGKKGGEKGRWAKCAISGGAVTIYSPWNRSRTGHPLCCWCLRVCEVNAPEGVEPIEWILLTDEPVHNLQDAVRLSGWYSLRWMIEQYHQCLKSGCKIEGRQLEAVDRLEPLIGMSCVLAVRLLQLKNDTRLMPQAAAIEHVPSESVKTLAKMLKVAAETITLRQFTHEVAKLGGFVGRKGDGEPGWLTLWRGWHELDLITYGAQLVTELRGCG